MAELTNPVPYEGKENYIFVSYSHMDTDKVMPIIRRWTEEGYRVWYDDGISPGTEWPEVIAQHLNDCELFVSFLSNSYMDSFNCRREIDFAVRKRKSFLAVFLEETELSLGVEMQISTVQSVDYYRTTPEIFLEKFSAFEVVRNSGCRIEKTADQPAEETVQTSSKAQTAAQPATEPAIATTEQTARETAPKVPKARKAKVKILIPILLGVFVLLGVAGAVTGIIVSKSNKKTSGITNSSTLQFADTTVTAKMLRKEVKSRDIRKIKLTNCELSIKNSEVWAEILNENVYEIIITGCGLSDEDANAILSNAPGLKRVDFSDNDLQSISFGNNPKLETAELSRNRLSHIDKTNLEKLKELHIDENAFTNLEFLETAVHLQVLTANKNSLDSIDTLKNCALLTRVLAAENNITDVTALKASRETLRDINLSHNKITDISVIGVMPALQNLDLDDNQLVTLFLTGSEKLSYLSARNNLIDSFNGDWDALTYIDLADNNLSGEYYFQYSSKLRKGFFENNNITLAFLSGEGSGTFSFYNNPLVKIYPGKAETSYDFYISYNEKIEPDFKNKIGRKLYLLDCPYDKRVEFESVWGSYNVTFPEKNEVVEAVEKQRKDF